MAKIERDCIKSDTKWIKMVARKDHALVGKLPASAAQELWYLTIYISGVELEFLASEGSLMHLFTQEEALQRVKEFEEMLEAENKDYFHDTLDNLLALVQRKPDPVGV